MAAGNFAAGVSWRHTAGRRRRPQQRGQNSTAATMAAATARKWHHRPCPPRPWGLIPCNLRRHANTICILAKAQPKVVKQLVAGADKDLINTLSECATNILNGNMILQPHQKQHWSRYASSPSPPQPPPPSLSPSSSSSSLSSSSHCSRSAEQEKRPDLSCHHQAWWTITCPRQTMAMGPASKPRPSAPRPPA